MYWIAMGILAPNINCLNLDVYMQLINITSKLDNYGIGIRKKFHVTLEIREHN